MPPIHKPDDLTLTVFDYKLQKQVVIDVVISEAERLYNELVPHFQVKPKKATKEEKLRVIIAGSRDIDDYNVILESVKESGFTFKEVVSGNGSAFDGLVEQYAKDHKVPCKLFPPDWKNIDVPNALVRESAKGKYNARAGFDRNLKMSKYSDAAIIITNGSDDTKDIIEQAKAQGLKIYIKKVEKAPF